MFLKKNHYSEMVIKHLNINERCSNMSKCFIIGTCNWYSDCLSFYTILCDKTHTTNIFKNKATSF